MQLRFSIFQWVFWLSVGVVFAITGIGKLLLLLSDNRVLNRIEAVFHSQNSTLLWVAIGVEGLSLCVLLLPIKRLTKNVFLVWICSNFLIYRVANAIVAPGTPCECLGAFAKFIPVGTGVSGWLTMVLLVGFVALGTYLIYSEITNSNYMAASLANSGHVDPVRKHG